MPRGKRTPAEPEVKAAVVADLMLGASVTATAKKYGVTRQAVQKWRDQAGVGPMNVSDVVQEKRLVLGEKIAVLLDEGLETFITHARLARDPAWFANQTAESLAVYDGVLFDKIAFILGNLRDVAEDEAGRIPIDGSAEQRG